MAKVVKMAMVLSPLIQITQFVSERIGEINEEFRASRQATSMSGTEEEDDDDNSYASATGGLGKRKRTGGGGRKHKAILHENDLAPVRAYGDMLPCDAYMLPCDAYRIVLMPVPLTTSPLHHHSSPPPQVHVVVTALLEPAQKACTFEITVPGTEAAIKLSQVMHEQAIAAAGGKKAAELAPGAAEVRANENSPFHRILLGSGSAFCYQVRFAFGSHAVHTPTHAYINSCRTYTHAALVCLSLFSYHLLASCSKSTSRLFIELQSSPRPIGRKRQASS